MLEFADGVTATLTASRLGQEKVRALSITQVDNLVRVDLIRQDITLHSQQQVSYVDGGAGYRVSGIVETPFIANRGEPLAIELDHFVSCVLNRAKPIVSGDDGLNVLELAHRIEIGATTPL
jgi:predicted dehydrogenase